jgi:hypothetical protein
MDLYQLRVSTCTFLEEVVKASKIHYVGFSNFTRWQLQLIISTAKATGVQVPVTLPPQLSIGRDGSLAATRQGITWQAECRTVDHVAVTRLHPLRHILIALYGGSQTLGRSS